MAAPVASRSRASPGVSEKTSITARRSARCTVSGRAWRMYRRASSASFAHSMSMGTDRPAFCE